MRRKQTNMKLKKRDKNAADRQFFFFHYFCPLCSLAHSLQCFIMGLAYKLNDLNLFKSVVAFCRSRFVFRSFFKTIFCFFFYFSLFVVVIRRCLPDKIKQQKRRRWSHTIEIVTIKAIHVRFHDFLLFFFILRFDIFRLLESNVKKKENYFVNDK